MDQQAKSLEQIRSIGDNLAKGGTIILTQKERVDVYRLRCASPSCGKVFYEFTSMKYCPHCAGEVTSNVEDDFTIECEILLNTQTGQISAGARTVVKDKRPKN